MQNKLSLDDQIIIKLFCLFFQTLCMDLPSFFVSYIIRCNQLFSGIKVSIFMLIVQGDLYLSRFFDCLAHPNLRATFSHWSKMTLKLSSYLLPKFSRVPFPLLVLWLTTLCSTLVRDTKMTFKGHFWSKLHLGLDAISNPKILKDI